MSYASSSVGFSYRVPNFFGLLQVWFPKLPAKTVRVHYETGDKKNPTSFSVVAYPDGSSWFNEYASPRLDHINIKTGKLEYFSKRDDNDDSIVKHFDAASNEIGISKLENSVIRESVTNKFYEKLPLPCKAGGQYLLVKRPFII